MGYYVDNDFGDEYINLYKQQIKNLWEKEYMSTQPISELPNETNILTAHILKKCKSVRSIDELSNYLNNPQADYKANILEYWKVNH